MTTLGLYRAGRAQAEIPVWRMIATPPDELRARAESLAEALAGRIPASVVALRSTVGGGSLPGETLASWGVAIAVPHPDRFVTALRRATPCVIARVEGGRVLLDLRTVLDDPMAGLRQALLEAAPA